MNYTKIIRSGDLVEEWVYERAPSPKRLIKKEDRRPRSVFPKPRRPDAIALCRKSFRRLVRANLDPKVPLALLTLTTAENIGVDEGYRMYTLLGKRLRTKFGSELRWLAVPEFQKRGAIHFHVLMWGLPPELPCILSRSLYTDRNGKKRRRHVCPETRQCERKLRTIANIWGQGFADCVLTDGSVKLAGYLAKYMAKAMHDRRLIGKRAYSASRNVSRPSSATSASIALSYARQEWIGVDNPCITEKEYGTLFLGRCIYKSYLIQNYAGTESPIDCLEDHP